jgi:riboflavin kinase / FMN adenylyltransferase
VLELSNSVLPDGYTDTAVAIGKFDGIHLGHQQLFRELVHFSEEAGLAAAVLTFDRHPDAFLKPGTEPSSIIGPIQKSRIVESLGADALITLRFDQQLANLSPEEFVVDHLMSLRAKLVLVGQGFRFGFEAKEVPTVVFGDLPVSSTEIRKAIAAGNIKAANAMLGRNHQTEGIVEHGRKIGRKIGFPTANLARNSEGLLPVDGVYAGWLHSDGVRYPAAHSVGTNDSIEAVPRLLESHVIGRDDLDLYDKIVTCEYVEQVRPWAKYESMEKLIEQIGSDVEACRRVLGE